MIDFIKDADCTKETPVKLGVPDAPIYGKGIKLKPRVDGRTDSEHFKKIYLPELLPLEEYDLIVVLISGGKDSVACYLKLLELGVPKERIEFWHHDIDGGHPSRRMDWKCTQNYVKALADAEGIKLRVSYRVNGFFGELYRIGASEPIEWIDPDTGEVKQCKLSSNYLKCKELKEQATEEMEELLKKYGYRMKFPAKTGDLSRRWCSAYLKICVADTVVSNLDRLGELEELGGKRHKFPAKGGTHSGRWCSGNLKAAVQDSVTANLEETKRDKKILIVSGERRGESAGRSKYNEMEIHRTNAEAKAHRIVHQWRCCIDYSEKDVWELLKRHHINPHPCYRINGLEGADANVVALYNSMAKLETIENNGIPFKISHGKNHAVSTSTYTLTGNLADVKLTIPKLQGENLAGQVNTTLHEEMHLMDLYGRKDPSKSGNWFSTSRTALMDVFKSTSDSISDEVADLFAEHKKEYRRVRDEVNAKYQNLISELNNSVMDKTFQGSLADYKKQYNKLVSAMNDERDYMARNIMGGGIGNLEDIYDALSGGVFRDKGTVMYGHGSSYYRSQESRVHETIANYAALSITRPDLIELLKADKPDLVAELDATIVELLKKVGDG